MNMDQIICPLCGSALESEDASTCASCPLHSACIMVCCPTCGYTVVSPERSRLARAAIRLMRTLRRLVPSAVEEPSNGRHTLADAPIDVDLQIIACSSLAREYRDWLQAYGVQPGHCVRVVQHRPVTIVQIAQDELALEPAIAQAVQVERIDASEPARAAGDWR